MRRVLIVILLFIAVLSIVYSYLFFQNREDQNVLTLFGNVDVRQVDIGFRVNGRVIAMPFQEGDFVAKDSLMGTLDKQPYLDRVLEAEANISSIKRSFENAERVFKRRQELIRDGSISQEDFDNTQANRDVLAANLKQAEASLGVALTNLRDTEAFAPNDGTILTRVREPGTVVKEGEPIYTLSLISPVWIRAFVDEPSLGKIFAGMRATIYTDTKDGPTYDGHIGFISPVAEFTPKTVQTTQLRTDLVYRLRIIADNPDWGLKQGMPVTVKLDLNQQQKWQ